MYTCEMLAGKETPWECKFTKHCLGIMHYFLYK